MKELDKKRKQYTKKEKEPYSPEMDIAWEKLSARELQCVYWVIRGYTNEEVGQKLCIEGVTIERHINAIYSKTNISLVSGSQVRKLLWFANRDSLIEHLNEKGELSEEYLASRSVNRSLLIEYRKQLDELMKENERLKQRVSEFETEEVIGSFGPARLTHEEKEVAKLIKIGLTDKEVAKELGKETLRVSYLVKVIKFKLGLDGCERITRNKLVAKLNEIGFESLSDKFDKLDPKLRTQLEELAERLDS